MKFNKAKVILSVAVFILLSSKANISHAEIKNGQTVSADKIWSIKFSKNVLWNASSQSSIMVVDENGEDVKANVTIEEDKKTILVKPPLGAYINGKKYTLEIKNEVTAEENGGKIKNQVEMTFYINSSPLPPQNAVVPNEDEIASGNLQSAGTRVMVKYKDYIYYRDVDNYSELYRMKEDGSGKEPVSSFTVMGNMSLDGHYLYYKTLMSSAIVKVDLDTNKAQYVNLKAIQDGSTTHFDVEEIPSSMLVKDNWIYFTQNDLTFGFYKMKSDGTGKMKLADNVSSFFIDGNWIYYKDMDNHLNKMQLDGSNISQIINEEVDKFYVLGSQVLYTTIDDNCIKRANTDGSSIETIISNPSNPFFNVSGFNIIGNSLYYINGEDTNDQKISKVNLNPQNGAYVPEVVDSNSCNYIMLLGNTIWYTRYGRYFSKLDTNGENLVTLDKQYVNFVGADKDWIYYIERGQGSTGDGKIFKIKSDGSQKTLVLDGQVQSADIDDNYIYYQADMKVHKCNKDGSNDVTIADEYGMKTNFDLKIDGDWIYYVECHNENGNFTNNLYRIQKDGSNEQLVTAECSSLLATDSGWVYYISQGDNSPRTLYQIKGDGTAAEKIGEINNKNFAVQGDYMYFIDSSGHIYKKKVGNSEKPVLVYGDDYKVPISIAGIENGYLYFFNNETNHETAKDTYNLAKMSTEDDKYTNIAQTNGAGLSVKNGFVYYLEDETKWVQAY